MKCNVACIYIPDTYRCSKHNNALLLFMSHTEAVEAQLLHTYLQRWIFVGRVVVYTPESQNWHSSRFSHCFRLHILRLSVCLCLPSVLLIRIGDIGFFSIDVYTFSPEQHVLRIDFVDVFGSAGVFEYEFFGAVRPSKSHTALISSTDYTLFSYSAMHVHGNP